MDQVIRKIQLVAVAFILIATALAFLIEVNNMYIRQTVDLADLLLLFIYIEVIGMIRLFWESKSIRITYPLLIAITALARFIILQGKGVDPINLIYEASAILLISVAILLLKMRKSKLLGLDRVKEGEDS
jgi:protein PsiE